MIQVIKLITGEEWIAEVDEQQPARFKEKGNDIYEVQNPLTMSMTDKGFSLVPVFFLSDSIKHTVNIQKSHVVYMYEPTQKLQDVYTKQFETIVTPDTNLVLP